ncbi:superfamily I DNA and RNA helicase [Mucilaginibacter sp. OAE612]|uniref:DEAD/DEAH box helicase n=1 Tax=Mucilaginibacter sp. OAE612 TaxID=3156444 RepID=UPI00359D37A6
MEKNINETILNQDPSAKGLIELIESIKEIDLSAASIYHHFPFYVDETFEGSLNVNLLFIDKNFGILIFKCVEAIDNRDNNQIIALNNDLSVLDSLIYSKLIKVMSLQAKRRELKVNATTLVYIHNPKLDIEYNDLNFDVFSTRAELIEIISTNAKTPLTEGEFKELKATIEGSRGIVNPKDRPAKTANSKGAILSRIESEIWNFDLEQKRAALFTIDGPQRIRGLAGSGKTVILARKVAQIHIQEPDAHILYTYYTKALYDIVKRYITKFYRQFSEKDPNWDKIHILHAWGGKALEGVYSNACKANNIMPINLSTAKSIKPSDPFDFVCEDLVKMNLKIQYDYSILDEAQDFPPNFYRLCRKLTKKNKVVWAYDDFQNILNVNIQNEKETFGKDSAGNYNIEFKGDDALQDIVLHKCYRNPKDALVCAFALGLGIYNDSNVIVQRLESNEHWESLGFIVEDGDSKAGSNMTISRPDENSPLLKNSLLNVDSVKMHCFNSLNQECENVADAILTDIEDGLFAEDIAVICLDNRNTKSYFSIISERLEQGGVNSFNLMSAPNDNTTFKVKDHVTLTSIYKAKGNETGSVYIIGVDSVFDNKDSINERNKLFTAITRSHAWVTITGIGKSAELCKIEIDKLIANKMKLIFKQPSEEEVVTIRQDIAKKDNKINAIAEEINKLGLSKEDLLKRLFNEKS